MEDQVGYNITFSIHYQTQYGQNLRVIGNIPELGSWNASVPLNCNGQGTWELSFHTCPETDTEIEYKYLVDNCGSITWEPESNHVLNLSPTTETVNIEVHDVFRWNDAIQNCYTRSAFVDAIHSRSSEKKINYISTPKSNLECFFSCITPNIRYDHKLVLMGSCPELGQWDPSKGIEMRDNEMPRFTASVQIARSSFPFEYKYAIVKPDGYVVWDIEANFFCPQPRNPEDGAKTVVCCNQFYVSPDKALFHGLGVYVPLFSLRTKESCGIGQYTDIKPLVDLCNKMGSSLIQLLPINDTTDKGDWADSYPYRQVSCFALHPIYINLLAITDKLTPAMKTKIAKFTKEQEAKKELDYPAVFAFKSEMLREIFKLVEGQIHDDVKFNQFCLENGDWLKPYALYCYYRDLYGTSDFRTWPEHSTIEEEEFNSLTAELGDKLTFINWIQFICDNQFREASEYAASHHVAIKGDLPIGVYLNSVECWAFPRNFRLDMCAGAPPDAFSDAGQNWGFPTYDWNFMESDNYTWWCLRLKRMATLFHALRVDHILGFFRIWEIPRSTCVRGMLGHFFPCNPSHRSELEGRGLHDIERYRLPYVRWHLLCQKFGGEAEWVSKTFFNSRGADVNDDWYDFKPEYDNEKKIDAAIDEMFKDDPGKAKHYKTCLFQLMDDVLIVPDPYLWDNYHPRTTITLEHIEITPNGPEEFGSPAWMELPEPQKTAIKDYYNEFTFKRQNHLWVTKAGPKLNILKNSTNMLICAEDLGQLTDEILAAITGAGLLSLRVQRMSKDPKDSFDDYHKFSYMSVCCPSTHDCSSLRGWWEENFKVTDEFWHNILLRLDNTYRTCETWISEMIIKQHLFSESMWAIFLLQDIAGLQQNLRRQTPQEEQINIPADPNHHWCYRYPYTLEELIQDADFTPKVHGLVVDSHRI